MLYISSEQWQFKYAPRLPHVVLHKPWGAPSITGAVAVPAQGYCQHQDHWCDWRV
jgi:hypothetical protein